MEVQIFFKRSRKLIVVTILFLLLATLPAHAALWGNKTDINTEDFRRIVTELRIYDDPDLPYYNEIFRLHYAYYTGSEELLDALNKKIEITQQVMKMLDADIKKEELGNLTYGRYILNAINEEELVEIGLKMGSPGQANGEYFSKLGENLANWESQLSKLLLTKIIVATCTAMGAPALSIGISTLGLFCDLSIIKTSINKLNEVWYEKAFWSYILFRNEPNNYGHTDAWTQLPESYINHIFILFPEKQKKAREAIEENFKFLWDKYGDHIVNNKLDEDFKSQQRESLKILLLYALEAEPHPLITSPLKITPVPPYYVEDTINAEFTITNQGKLPINFSVLTVGGRDPDDQVADFTHRQNITIGPFEYYNYKGTLTLKKLGDYHFFCTYQTLDGEWNTCVDLGSGLTDGDRTKEVMVIAREAEKKADYVIEFKDPYLEAAVRRAIGNLSGNIYPKDVTDLTALLAGHRIKSLEGIQNLTNLKVLIIEQNQVTDISALKNLTNLKELYFNTNQVRDISALKSLTNLKVLDFHDNQVRDISALKNLTNLEELDFFANQITDISALKNLTNLKVLSFGTNQVRDISALKSLTNLKELSFGRNQVTDISALKNLTNLEVLFFHNNQVSDISVLKNLTNLKDLYFPDNQVTDISALVENEGFGPGDCINMDDNYLDLTEGSQNMQDIKTLIIGRSVKVTY